jgi:hypothetical protein
MKCRDSSFAFRASIVAAIAICGGGCHDDDPPFPAYDTPNSVDVVDMNGDGVNDIVFAATHVDGSYPNAGIAGVILQNSAAPGTFQVSLDSAVGANPSTLAVGDLDGISGPDVAVANANSASISVLLHNATPSNAQLPVAINVNTGGVPYDVAVGDLNGDGLPDLAVADVGASLNVVVHRRDPASPGYFLAPIAMTVGNPATSVAIGDLNGDGRMDLAVTNVAPGGAGYVSIFFQTATAGTFSPRVDMPAGTVPLSVKIGDLNNDGRADLAVANEGPGSTAIGAAGVSVLLQSATTPGTYLPAITYATTRGSVCVAIGDLNNDGFNDLAVANTGGSRAGTISILLQDATRPGIFLAASNYRGVYEPLGLAIGNLNGDLLPDIAVADGDRATVMFNSSTTPGTFATPLLVGR